MTGNSVCVVSRNQIWSECLRRKLAPRWHVDRYDNADECLLKQRTPCCCALVFPLGAEDFEMCLRLPTEFLRRGAATPVIFLIDEQCRTSGASCWEAGAAAVLSPALEIDDIANYVRSWIRRWQPLSHALAGVWQFQNHVAQLSPRERFIMERLADGWLMKQIASALGTSLHTVRNQRASLLNKLQIESDRELMRLVLASRLLLAILAARGAANEELDRMADRSSIVSPKGGISAHSWLS